MVVYFSRKNVFGIRRWYFHVRARNGKILCQSEAYNSKRSRDEGYAALRSVTIRDLTPVDRDR